MDDVARRAGVSAITISRVLRSPELVAPHTRERVRQAVAEVGYIPNAVAGSLASSATRTIAAVVPTFDNPIFAEMLQGMFDVLRPAEYQLLLGSHNYDLDQEEDLVRAFLSRQVDAVILTGANRTSATRFLLERSGVPAVTTWTLESDDSCDCVGFSNRAAAREMVHHLHERGYREICFVSTPTHNNDRAAERRRGFEEALDELGLRRHEGTMLTRPLGLEQGAQALGCVLERRPETDAVFFANDSLAAGALFEAQRRGIRVPEDVAIAGFDDQEIARQTVPGLTTVRVPRYAVGAKAAQLILDALGEERQGTRHVDLGFEVVVRGST